MESGDAFASDLSFAAAIWDEDVMHIALPDLELSLDSSSVPKDALPSSFTEALAPFEPLSIPDAPAPSKPTHSRKRKHDAPNTHVPRAQRCRSTASYKFQTVQEEVYYRLYESRVDAKSQRLNALVRTCFHRFGDAWVTWETVKQTAVEVGYSPKNNMFRTVWALTVSRYGRNSEGVQNNEVFGLNFPYWMARREEPVPPAKRGQMMLRLSPEFFAFPVPLPV